MTDYSKNEFAPKSPEFSNGGSSHQNFANNYDDISSDELSELRSLLLGVEPTQLQKLYERLNNPQIQAEDISSLLPEAVILRTIKDKLLAEAMVPTVEQAIQSSVKKDLNVLSEAFFPIIGPATRKAIATALDEMIQSLNQTLEHSLSPQSFKWRLEARQTGKSFAEVVLLRTLIYRVEQVFLIHKKTGLLLQHTIAPLVMAQDPDLISAMLTAIQDFIKDSFNVKKSETLQSLEFGELFIWVEEGPQAMLAGIIRGNAPQELRLVFQEVLEKIHFRLSKELNTFEGETEPFAASKPYLQVCLSSRYKSPVKKNYTYVWSVLATSVIALGILGFFTIREQLRWNAYLQKLNSQPGIVVIKAQKRHGKYFITGMRDPLAADPQMLMKQVKLNPKQAIAKWEPYLSFEAPFIKKRAEEFLQVPKTVSLNLDANGILYATGTAPRNWIISTRKLWRFIPGVTQYVDKNLVELELSDLESQKKQIEQKMLFFVEGAIEFIPGENNKLTNLVKEIQKLLDTAKYLGKSVRIEIIGHANTTGIESRNIILSQDRANKILSYLISQGINTSNLTAVGVGSSQPFKQGFTQQDKQVRPRVSFNIILADTRK
ncbi:OmpA family protein [Chlorogloeopsis sp. ULAP02]|uniref:OmpA family protein n=1 Tax=Chlorogloeopsis sp. ULAP02 TaxID=3107926 RepID=UPI0031351820